jgi:aerobic carbon-monoxide dehydrogenase small subunit
MERQVLRRRFRVNGQEVALEIEPHEFLLDVLRERLQLTGAKRSCDVQVCGACTVLVDGRAVSSCSYLAADVEAKSVLTIEGLAQGDKLHPLQELFVQTGGFQCGFCTPGMILSTKALLDENPHPTRQEIMEYLDGNICRCTGYFPIVEAVLLSSETDR